MQDSVEWLKWRSDGIGGSDIPVLFGLCKYRNYEQFLIEKIHPEEFTEIKTGFIQELGHHWEKVIRNKIYLETFEDYQPALLCSEQYPYMKVSLDGHNPTKKTLIEIKLTGKEKYNMILNKKCPENFLYQIQYQLAVTGYGMGVLYAVRYRGHEGGTDIKDVIKLEIKPDRKLQEKIIIKVKDVWDKIVRARKRKCTLTKE